jgi:hypothetical protein
LLLITWVKRNIDPNVKINKSYSLSLDLILRLRLRAKKNRNKKKHLHEKIEGKKQEEQSIRCVGDKALKSDELDVSSSCSNGEDQAHELQLKSVS